MQGKFRYLNVGLGVILAFVGVKMLVVGAPFHVHLPTFVSLAVIAAVITASVVASLLADARDGRAALERSTGPTTSDTTASEADDVEARREPTSHTDATRTER